MLFLLSPAKRLDFSDHPLGAHATRPRMMEETAALARTAKRLTAPDLKRLMHLSDDLAKLNRERFRAFDPEAEGGLPAALAFAGDVYIGLDARSLDGAAMAWAQDHVRSLSGLYGVLRPLDAIQPHRLEMGTRLKTRRGSSLYDFWGDRIARRLDADLEGHADGTLVNLASEEYFGAVDRKALKAPVLTIRFLEEKDGERRPVSFFAKKARGLMARWAIDNRVERAEDLKAFDVDGYRLDETERDEWTFVRAQPEPVGRRRAA
ncbi:peroxide stress protein YaaA [Brevundimonas sp.]|uniref:peroxide stress protein YaaA n=1 Tax=Brevundimonas sp. TaxID=1871086 RepID=UPI0025E917E6|nr:peroxide stress protein YaaA [Brevundimonas sp.]